MTARTSTAIALTVLLTAACYGDVTGPISQQEEGLVLERLTDTEVQGRYESANHVISFFVVETEPGVVELALDVDGVVIQTYVDMNSGVGNIDIDNAILNVDQLAVLTEMNRALADAFEADGMTAAEDHLVRATAYMAVAPADVELAPLSVEAARGWTYLSCSCRSQYIGSGYYRTVGKGWSCGGGNGCKGRCGGGCGSSGRGAYTRDCAKHDWGLGSWWRASDDYFFAGWNC